MMSSITIRLTTVGLLVMHRNFSRIIHNQYDQKSRTIKNQGSHYTSTRFIPLNFFIRKYPQKKDKRGCSRKYLCISYLHFTLVGSSSLLQFSNDIAQLYNNLHPHSWTSGIQTSIGGIPARLCNVSLCQDSQNEFVEQSVNFRRIMVPQHFADMCQSSIYRPGKKW